MFGLLHSAVRIGFIMQLSLAFKILLGSLAGIGLYAQWPPYTAIHTVQIRYTDRAGQTVRQDISTSTEARNTAGFFRRDASVGNSSYLWNPDRNEASHITHATRSVRSEKFRGTSVLEYGPRGSAVREEIVGGERCSVYPLLDGESRKPIGEICYSAARKLTLRREVRLPTDNGGQMIRIETRGALRFEEPSNVEFSEPTGYARVDSCVNCAR